MCIDISPALIWFLVGLALVLIELVVPGIIMVFFGVGAWVVALTTWWGWTSSPTWQLALFTIASLLMLATLRRTVRSRFFGHVACTVDGASQMDDFTGSIVTVTTAITPGGHDGRIEFKGAEWNAVSDDTLPIGSSAEILTNEGIVLHVRKIEGEKQS